MPATYMRRMHNNNLEIRIAGSSCHPQQVWFFLVELCDGDTSRSLHFILKISV